MPRDEPKTDIRYEAITALERSDWRRIIELTSQLLDVRNHARDLWLWRSQAKIRTGDFFGAREDLRRITTETGADVYTSRLMYDLEAARRNWSEAASWAKKLVQFRPVDGDSHLRLSRARLAGGDIQGAALALTNASRGGSPQKLIEELSGGIRVASRRAKEFNARVQFHRASHLGRDFFSFGIPETDGCTVVIPAFNAEHYLEATIDSVIGAGHNDIEIIIVDDFSNDQTSYITAEYAKRDARIRSIRLKKNSGSAIARNHGILHATKTYLTFLDADDLMIEGGIGRRIAAAKRARRVDRFIVGSYGGSTTISETLTHPPRSTEVTGMKVVDYLSSEGRCPFNANQPLFFTAFLKNSGGFPESSRTAEDWPYWVKLLRRGGVIVPTHRLDVTYRMRPNSLIRHSATEHMHRAVELLRNPYRSSAELFSKPLEEYKIQREYAPRFFSFWGMRIAKAANEAVTANHVAGALSEKFRTEVENALPDLGLLLLRPEQIENQLLNGVSRYLCVKQVRSTKQYAQLKQLVRGFAFGAYDYGISENSKSLRSSHQSMKQEFDVAFFPHKRYHARSAHLIIQELQLRGVRSIIIDFSSSFGEEGVQAYLDEHQDLAHMSYTEYQLSLTHISVAVVFNDWDPIVKGYLEACKRLAIPTVGIVEGVNDYHSVDTKSWRPAYQFVDHLLLPGQFDRRYFPKHDSLHVCGVQRLDPMLSMQSTATDISTRHLDCVINSNFTYGVLTDKRLGWLRDVCSTLTGLGLHFVISRHPQDTGSIQELEAYVDHRSMYKLIEETKVFITRFSGAVYEALLAKTNVIYYSPGIERWDMFSDPLGAYEYITHKNILKHAVLRSIKRPFNTNDTQAFLKLHCDIGEDISSSEKTANVLSSILRTTIVARKGHADDSAAPSALHMLASIHAAAKHGDIDNAIGICRRAKYNKRIYNVAANELFDKKYASLLVRSRVSRQQLLSSQKLVGRKCDNLFLVMSCLKYRNRINMLRPLYRSRISHNDRVYFVVGGAESDEIDGDVINLQCGDLYENLPSKVFHAIRLACRSFEFEHIVKIDDDVFLNFDNFYQVISAGVPSYYGRRNPPTFGTPLNDRWHFGKVSDGHIYHNIPFPIFEPAQWNSGGFYLLDYKAATAISLFSDTSYVYNHVYEDYMIYTILADAGISPSFHENSEESGLKWMLPNMSGVIADDFSRLQPSFDLSSVVSIHCGPTTIHEVDHLKLSKAFDLLNERTCNIGVLHSVESNECVE